MMNKFNQLYNLILESIITQNSESRRTMIQKSDKIPEKQKFSICMYLSSIAGAASTKIADFLCKFFASREIKDIDDERIQQVIDILQRNTSFNIQQDITLDQFLKQNSKYIERSQAMDSKYLDSIPQFYDKHEYQKGVVVYRVKDTREGQAAVRKVVDAQWGEGSNPWCLIARKDGKLDSAWNMWNNYCEYPKQIAFQDGQLLAFRASDNDRDYWWDRKDRNDVRLNLKDGKESLWIDNPVWTVEQKKLVMQLFLDTFNIKLNPKTQMYDSLEDRVIQITDNMLIHGKLPIKFGVVKGGFEIAGCDSLQSLEGCPEEVWGNFNCSRNYRLTNLIGGPKRVHRRYTVINCDNLISLEGSPEQCAYFDCSQNQNLKNLEGASKFVSQDFECNHCSSLTSLIGAPDYVGGNFDCSYCSLTTLEGAPQTVQGTVYMICNNSLKSLQNGFTKVARSFFAHSCDNLQSLKGAPKRIGGDFRINDCPKLRTYQGGPEYIGRDLVLDNCKNIKDLKGLQEVWGFTHVQYCYDLRYTSEQAQKFRIR